MSIGLPPAYALIFLGYEARYVVLANIAAHCCPTIPGRTPPKGSIPVLPYEAHNGIRRRSVIGPTLH